MKQKSRLFPNLFMIVLIVAGILIVSNSIVSAQVWVYDYPDTLVNTNNALHKRSTLVKVEVEQEGEMYESFVMFDKNQHPSGNLAMNPDNHWTNFSMKGSAKVHVTRTDNQQFTFCTIYPTKKGITPEINGNVATFTIEEEDLPLQIYVEMNNMGNNAVLIFADPEEDDVPDMDDPDHVEVIYTTDDIQTVRNKLQNNKTYKHFEKGIHQWGSFTGPAYAGYKLPISAGKKIYIPGGAYVVGSFSGNASNYKIYGRGIISAAGKDVIPGVSGIPYSLVQGDGDHNTGIVLNGFVTLCPPHFAITVRGKVDINNVKMMSWWHSTDGIVTGHNSTVKNCFFKVMDDFIKLYSDNCYYENNTMFHQVNGAPFQYSWGNQHSKNNLIVDTYIINSIYKNLSGTSNTAVINARSGNTGNITENQIFDGLYIDNGCHRLLGLEPNGGTHRNFEIRNVELNSGNKQNPQKLWSYLLDGNFSNIEFHNFTINGYPVITTNNQADRPDQGSWWFQGNAAAIVFASCADTIPPKTPGKPEVMSVDPTGFEVEWMPSSDDIGLNGYDVFVNNTFFLKTTDATTTLQGLFCGQEYTVKIRAVDLCGNISGFSDTILLSTEVCIRHEIPGEINPEEYAAIVGIELLPDPETEGSMFLGYINSGNRVSYDINVSTAGNFVFEFIVASGSQGGTMQLLVDNESMGLTFIPGTGGWDVWTSIKKEVALDAGQQTITLNFLGPSGDLFHIRSIDVQIDDATNIHQPLLEERAGIHQCSFLKNTVVLEDRLLSVNLNNQGKSNAIQIYDINGRLVLSARSGWIENFQTLHLPQNISPGLYIIHFNNSTHICHEKFWVR